VGFNIMLFFKALIDVPEELAAFMFLSMWK
jgi:hypothetical protein